MNTYSPVLRFALVLAFAGCAKEEGLVARGGAGSEARPLAVDAELSVGNSRAPEAVAFLGVYAGYLRDSSFVVADGGSLHVLVFDYEGRVLHRIGQKGAGPGEFRSIRWLAPSGSGMLVLDAAQRRVSMFSSRGELERSFWLPVEAHGYAEWIEQYGPEYIVALSTGVDPRRTRGTVRDSIGILLLARDAGEDGQAKVLRTLASLPHRWWRRKDSQGAFGLEALYEGQGALFASDGRTVWATGDEADRVLHIGSNGTDQVPMILPGVGKAAPGADASNGEHAPTFNQLLLSDEGLLWLSEYRVVSGMRQWWVVNASGNPIGELRLPGDLRILDIRGTRILAVRRDPNGVELVEILRVREMPQTIADSTGAK